MVPLPDLTFDAQRDVEFRAAFRVISGAEPKVAALVIRLVAEITQRDRAGGAVGIDFHRTGQGLQRDAPIFRCEVGRFGRNAAKRRGGQADAKDQVRHRQAGADFRLIADFRLGIGEIFNRLAIPFDALVACIFPYLHPVTGFIFLQRGGVFIFPLLLAVDAAKTDNQIAGSNHRFAIKAEIGFPMSVIGGFAVCCERGEQ